MKEIIFVGNTQSDYASRWKRELEPETVNVGKSISKVLASVKDTRNIPPQTKLVNKVLRSGLNTLANVEEKLAKSSIKAMSGYNDYLRDKRKIHPAYISRFGRGVQSDNGKYKIFVTDKNKLEKLRANKKAKSALTTITGQKSTRIIKPKINRLGKLGKRALGIVAIGGLGVAAGYKLTRKMRKDKGKKRGKYNY